MKPEKTPWSAELTKRTRLELEEMLTCTDPDTGKKQWALGSMVVDAARFKNADGTRFGMMTVENAAVDKWIIQLDGGGEESYETVDALLEAGWALD
jgi:hypothetical protein